MFLCNLLFFFAARLFDFLGERSFFSGFEFCELEVACSCINHNFLLAQDPFHARSFFYGELKFGDLENEIERPKNKLLQGKKCWMEIFPWYGFILWEILRVHNLATL